MRAGLIAAGRSNGVVCWINQPTAIKPFGGQRRDAGIGGYIDVRCAGFNEAAIARVGRAGIKGAAHIDGARLHIAQQVDHTRLVL